MGSDETRNVGKGNGEPVEDGFEWSDGAWSLTAEPSSGDLEDEEAQAILSELAETVRTGEVSLEASAGTRGRRKGKRLAKPEQVRRRQLTPTQRLLVLDVWLRSGLPAGDFAPLVGLSKHTLYVWKRDFKRFGPSALADKPRTKRAGKRQLPVATRRAILLLKQLNPDFGALRISQEILRGQGVSASEAQVTRVLREAGYETVLVETRAHNQRPVRFERARPNQLWQTDLFQFVLKKQNRRVYLLAYLDDHSRFLVSYGLHTNATAATAIEVLTKGISDYGPPEEVLTDNGPQYVSWRGRSRYNRALDKLGIKQVVARPKHPQTLGKIERFWQTLYRECVERAVFDDLEDARRRVGHFVDYYNFRRPHQGIDGLVPADRYFGVASEVKEMLAQRVAENALELARHGVPKRPLYLTGAIGGKAFSVHTKGERVVLSRVGGEAEEVELVGPESTSAGSELAELVPSPGEAMPKPLAQGTPMDIFDQLVDEALASEPDRSPLEQALSEVRADLESRSQSRSEQTGDGQEVGDE